MGISRILWPTDFSENAGKALPLVTELAQKFGAEIHILYVMKDYPAFGASYGQFDPEELKKMQEWEKQTAESRLSEICDKFLNECPLYIRHIAVGEPANVVLIDPARVAKVDRAASASLSRNNPYHGRLLPDLDIEGDGVVGCERVS